MKRLSLLILVFILACDTPRIVSSAAPGVDFKQFKSYQLADYDKKVNVTHPAYDNPTNREIIITAINSQMNALGYSYLKENPDLLVIYDIVITDMVDPRYDSAVVYKPWVDTKLDSFNYTEGLMIIRLIDCKSSEMVWQGSVTGILDKSPERFQHRIPKEVGKIFASLSEQVQ